MRSFFLKIKNFIRNFIKFRRILWNDQEWDFGFLEELIITKLECMAKYWETANIVSDSRQVYQDILRAIRIGKIAFEMEEDDEEPFIVNTRNWKRFMSTKISDRKIFYQTLRRYKARYVFYQILNLHSPGWWD